MKTEVRDVKGVARKVIQSKVDETGCFREVLDALERDVAQATLRANAWAEGDLETLLALGERNVRRECSEAFFGSELAEELGLADGETRAQDLWLNAVDTALQRNRDTFAVMPVDSLLEDGGWLARLRARGYEVIAPE